jgi:hypothetical protein
MRYARVLLRAWRINSSSGMDEPRPGSTVVVRTLRARLAEYRGRGFPCEVAWRGSCGVALKQAGSVEREKWRKALKATKATWRSCYEHRPSERGEVALQALGFDRDVRLPDIECPNCGGEVPQGANGRRAKWCSAACRRAGNRESVAA